MNNLVKAGLVLVVGGGVVWGAFAANHHFKCKGYEEDFLNAIHSQTLNHSVRTLFDKDSEFAKLAEEVDEISYREMKQSLITLHRQCGERATGAAMRKATAAAGFN